MTGDFIENASVIAISKVMIDVENRFEVFDLVIFREAIIINEVIQIFSMIRV